MKKVKLWLRSFSVKNFLFAFLGSFLYAFGLQYFLIPNHLFDNGTTGISVIMYYLTHFNLGIWFIIISIPFWIIGFLKISKKYFIMTIFSVISLSISTELLELLRINLPLKFITDDILLSSIFGGAFLGIGVGLTIRNGGSLDGVETLSLILSEKLGFSVGEIALFFNVFIFFAAGIIFSIDLALYSIISYFVSSKMIDIVIEGLNQAKNVFIMSDKIKQISESLTTGLGKGVTLFFGKGGYTGTHKDIIFTVVTRREIGELKSIVNKIDDSAFITISDVRETKGGLLRKKVKQ